jgi:hypothetical protein
MQKRKVGILLRKLMNLKYGGDNMKEIVDSLKSMDFINKKLPKFVRKKLIDHWVKDKINDDIMPCYSYVIDPTDEIDILIKFEEKNYLALVLVENRGHYPVYKKRINKEYIYVVVLEKRKESIFFKGGHILDDTNIASIIKFYEHILKYKQVLDKEVGNYSCDVEIYIKDGKASPFEYGRTGWCLRTIDSIYENLERKIVDFDNLFND